MEMVMLPQPTQSEFTALATALDAATEQQRIQWLAGLNKRELVCLFESAKGASLDLSALHGPEGDVSVHVGKNSLPLFSHFQKRIGLHEGTVQGYNHQSLKWLVGPGHFRVEPYEVSGELLFDYLWKPETVPVGFPKASSNRSGLSFFVYGNLQDIVRGVSRHVTVGRALMNGKLTNNYFGLCRVSDTF